MSSRQVQVIVRSATEFTERLIQRITLEITKNLIIDTPKDTGWAAANWVPTIGRPFTKTAGSRIEAELGNLDRAPQQTGMASLLTYRLHMGEVFISNNVHYVPKLNNGSSRKAPAGFIQAAIFRSITNVIKSTPNVI